MINLKVFTPKGMEFEANVKHIQVNDDVTGSFGVLLNHVPVISTIIHGYIYLEKDNGEEEYIALDGGVFKFIDNNASIVAQDIFVSKTSEDALDKLTKLIDDRKKENKARNVELALAENELKKQIKKTGAGNI